MKSFIDESQNESSDFDLLNGGAYKQILDNMNKRKLLEKE